MRKHGHEGEGDSIHLAIFRGGILSGGILSRGSCPGSIFILFRGGGRLCPYLTSISDHKKSLSVHSSADSIVSRIVTDMTVFPNTGGFNENNKKNSVTKISHSTCLDMLSLPM